MKHIQKEKEIDKHLVSAAPELLEVLKEVIEDMYPGPELAEKVEKAIAKAEGRLK